MQAPTSSLAELGSAKTRRCFRVTLYTAHVLVCLSCRNFSHGPVAYTDIEVQDETPGWFETPGSLRNHAHAQSANRLGKTPKWRGAGRAGRWDHLQDMSISQRRGGVQWHRVDQTRHILRAGMCVARCHFDSKLWRSLGGRQFAKPTRRYQSRRDGSAPYTLLHITACRT